MLRDEGLPHIVAAQDDVGGVNCLFRSYSRHHCSRRDLGGRQHRQFSPADSDPGGDRRNSCLSARSTGNENVSRNAYSHQGYSTAFRNWVFCIGRIGSMARSYDLGPERELSPGKSLPTPNGLGITSSILSIGSTRHSGWWAQDIPSPRRKILPIS